MRIATLVISIFLSFVGLMQNFDDWFDNFPVNPPIVGAPGDIIVSGGPSEGQVLTSASIPTMTFTGGNTYECKVDDGDWTACSTPYNPTMTNAHHTFQVRPLSVLSVPGEPSAVKTWTNFICTSGTYVNPVFPNATTEAQRESNGTALEAAVEASSATKTCAFAGDYETDSVILVGNNDQLLGQPGKTMTLHTEKTGNVNLPIPNQIPVKIHDGTLQQGTNIDPQGDCNSPYADPENLANIIDTNGSSSNPTGGSIILQWFDVSGADSKLQANTGATTDSCGGAGQNLSVGGAGSGLRLNYIYSHHSGAMGVSQNQGIISNSIFHDSTLEEAELGDTGASIKSVREYEVRYSLFYNEQGNGPWCDHECANIPEREKGFWVHNSITIDNARHGVRYEFSPRLTPDPNDGGAEIPPGMRIPPNPANFTHAGYVGIVLENNYSTENGFSGLTVQAAQNALIRNNQCGRITIEEIPDSMINPNLNDNWSQLPDTTVRGFQVKDRNFALNASGGKCIQSTDSHKNTDLWNTDIYNNTLFGENRLGTEYEGIQGCERTNDFVYCRGNNPTSRTGLGTSLSNNDDARDTTNAWVGDDVVAGGP